MKKILVILIIATCISVISCTTGDITRTENTSSANHNYFPELPQFNFSTTNNPNDTNPREAILSPIEILMTFKEQKIINDLRDSVKQKTAYIFSNVTTSNESLYILIPPGMADNIKLFPASEYYVNYQIHHGWPTAYGLIIKDKEEKLVFAGFSNGSPDNTRALNLNYPFHVTISNILTGNYVTGTKDNSWERKTNIELSFFLNEKSAVLHQGQSTILNGYEIKVLLARDVQYKPNWYDSVQNSISYIISRK